ncbi:unnamed protein product [Spirodela intermedia]|uniref:Uncharacterized protein n=1 Tax=Spirodela intermedia TaxID=51605 RepID=A0A7I8IGX5_SPIIN|nr:unnamed protein product [Spirodela intermedia]CAA6657129.1 unnamed protein product [Spirodela intermedia]
MGILHKRAIEASETTRPVPDLRTGDIVEIKLEVPENRRRVSIYKGIVMSRQNAGIHTTIRIRRIIAGIGVEIVFPIYSPNIKEIKVVKHRKVRRARLYYLRTSSPGFQPSTESSSAEHLRSSKELSSFFFFGARSSCIISIYGASCYQRTAPFLCLPFCIFPWNESI